MVDASFLQHGFEPEKSDLEQVSQALNRYWSVDQAAAVQLLRDCRRVRADARADEIAFFVGEKLELARGNRSITNPTGLVLATVPQSFAGSTFLGGHFKSGHTWSLQNRP